MMEIYLSNYRGRDIVIRKIRGMRRAFYRSSGRNSGRPDRWFPFKGILLRVGWMVKYHSEEYGRYGTEELKKHAEELDSADIPKDLCKRQLEPIEVNRDIGTYLSIHLNEDHIPLPELPESYIADDGSDE